MPSPFDKDLGVRRLGGSYLGEVVSIEDPDSLGRVEVRLMMFDGADDQDGPVWARVAVPVAGVDRGTFLVPDVGDEVLITFLGGDPRFPIVVGSLWNGNATPTETIPGNSVDRWSFTSKDGTRVSVVEESSGQSTFKVEVPGGVSAELTQSSGGKIELIAAGNTITIDSSGVAVDSPSQVTVTAATIDATAGIVNVDAPMATFSGVVQCTTLIATTVVGTTYTPGAGNIW